MCFRTPIFWAEEVLIFIVIWAVFLVAGSITYRGGHLNMDLFYAGSSPLGSESSTSLIALTLIVCTAFAATQSWKVVMLHCRNHSVTAGTDIPLVIPHAALLFGFSFMALAAIVRIRPTSPASSTEGAAMYWVMAHPAVRAAAAGLSDLPAAAGDLAGDPDLLLRSADDGGASDYLQQPQQIRRCWRCRSSSSPAT